MKKSREFREIATAGATLAIGKRKGQRVKFTEGFQVQSRVEVSFCKQ